MFCTQFTHLTQLHSHFLWSKFSKDLVQIDSETTANKNSLKITGKKKQTPVDH